MQNILYARSLNGRHRHQSHLAQVATSAMVLASMAALGGLSSTANASTLPSPTKSASPAPLTAVSPVAAVADNISTLAAEIYPSSSLGVSLSSSDVIEIYAVPSTDSAFLAAAQALDTQGFPTTVNDVTYSSTDLSKAMSTVQADMSTLASMGIHVQGQGPDVPNDTDNVTIAAPGTNDLSLLTSYLSSTGDITTVTVGNYQSKAASTLLSQFPGLPVSVDPTLGTPTAPYYGRYADGAPWWGGDALFSTHREEVKATPSARVDLA